MTIVDDNNPEIVKPYPDNQFFEAPDGHYYGGSWNGEVDGITATYGAIESGVSVTYSISSREVIFVETGTVTLEFDDSEGKKVTGTHQAGALFELPVGVTFTLTTSGDDKFVYGCLYPDSEE